MKDKAAWLGLLSVTSIACLIATFYRLKFQSDWLELVAFVTGVIAVYLVVKEHIWNWPIGIINVMLYGWVFFSSRLFADASLQVFFFVVQLHGWWNWLHGGQNKSPLKVSTLNSRQWIISTASVVIGTAAYVPIITYFKGAAPFADSVLTVISIVAQIQLNLKKLENWILWIIADACYIPLYISRGLHPTAFLYFVFLILAVMGYLQWQKSMRLEAAAP